MDIGRVGIWWSGSWRADDASADVAAEMEDLGYTALWSSGGFEAGLSPHFDRLLAATRRITVASGIVSVWAGAADEVSRRVGDLEAASEGRFLLGIGASHAPMVADYRRPYARVVSYLDSLDSLGIVTPDRRVLAALGPRMLRLAADRAAGAHPYFVPVEHTARARHDPRKRSSPGSRGHRRPRTRPVHGTGTGPDVHRGLPDSSQLRQQSADARLHRRRRRRWRQRPPGRRHRGLG